MIAPLYFNPTLRGCHSCMGFMGDDSAITPQAAMQQAIQESSGLKLNPRDFQNNTWLSKAEDQIAAGQFDIGWYSPSCAGQAAPNLNLFSTASGLALGTTSAAVGVLGPSGAALIPAAAVPVIGWVVAGVGAIVGLISAIFTHHAAAVKRDLSFGCSALPAVNNAFSVIAKAVQDGQIQPADAASALDQIYSEFQSAGGAAINDSPWCNSNCEMGVVLQGMVIYWKAQYTAMAATQAVVAASTSPTLTASDPSATGAEPVAESPISPENGFAVDPSTGQTVFVTSPGTSVPSAGIAAPGSWFTEQTIFASVPNWAVLVGGYVGLKALRVI
jgi:hypothetical protein